MRLQRHVLDVAEAFRPDLIVNVDWRLAYSVVPLLRERSRAPVVLWYPDPVGNLRGETYLLAGYDALFLTDSTIADVYRRTLGINAHFLPQGCNPLWHRPTGELLGPVDPPVVAVAGNMYVTRYLLLDQLASRGIALKLYGAAWSRWLPRNPVLRRSYAGYPVFREAKARAFRSASLVLNSMTSHEADGLNARLFEATACGAIVLSEWRGRLQEFFEVGTELFAYANFDALVDQIRTIARMSCEQREQIGSAAARRAHRDHSYRVRFDTLARVVGAG
jgi:spore maturation protein CgeB